MAAHLALGEQQPLLQVRAAAYHLGIQHLQPVHQEPRARSQLHGLQAEGEGRVQRRQAGLPAGLVTTPAAHLQPSASCSPGAGGSSSSCSSRELTTMMGLEVGTAEVAEKSAVSSSSR